jgi:hypothetical protein
MAEDAQLLGLSTGDIDDFVVTDSHTSKHNGVTHIYLRQRIYGIEVANGTMALSLDRGGKVLSRGNRLVNNLLARARPPQPVLARPAAILATAAELGLPSDIPLEILEDIGGVAQEAIFDAPGISLDTIPVRLAYYKTDDGTVRLSWEMVIHQPDQKHWWQLWTDAETGKILAKADWIAHDTYQVFAEPKESPSDGARTVEANPADPTASPFGWHDTNGVAGAESTKTVGNNVCAREDRLGLNFPCGIFPQPDGGAILDFSATLNLATQQPVDYQNAAVINLFYWNNILHDVLYQYGFNEVSGNFQENNYGNGGLAGDSVDAEAQDGSGTNNANFATPPDGSNPRMQMFEWLAPPDLTINSPAAIAGDYANTPAAFGPRLSSVGLTDNIVLVNDGVGTTSDGCTALSNGPAVSGSIALIDRGDCEFGLKVLNAENAGAVAAIVANNDGDGLVSMGVGAAGGLVTIPSLFIGQSDGASIKGQLPSPGVNATLATTRLDRDSDFDNGVIAHEYCHGLSNRLTNGPSSVSCLQQDQQAGEGWSDICTLFFSVTASDTAQDGHGIGTYLIFQPPTGSGIRPAPYSVDKSINPLTYGDIVTAGQAGGVSIPHGVGTVFATAAWDLHWKLVGEYGFDPDLYSGTGGNNIWFQLIVDGLKMQPCNPTFLDARDAILAADVANNAGANQATIWEAFARRGMGVSANDGGGGNSLAVTEAFDVPLAQCTTDLTLADPTYSGWNEFAASGTITVGPNTLFDGASFTLVDAGSSVMFTDGVEIGGQFSASNSPRPCS